MSKRILLCDDSEFYLNAIRSVLTQGGYEVVTAVSGTDGLAILRDPAQTEKGSFDLILCDITMPDMDGFGILKQVMAEPALKEIPFIFLTYLSDIGNMDRAMELGAHDYFIKSDTMLTQLLDHVQKVIG